MNLETFGDSRGTHTNAREVILPALQVIDVERQGIGPGVATLDQLITQRRTAPGFVRCDNGPELTANAIRDWCRFSGAGASYIEPGSPWENPYVESFGGRLRDELLAVEQFDTLLEARVVIEDWRNDYNHHRPHSSLGWRSPAVYAANTTEHQQPRLS